jgi:hypothetical protein
MKIRFSRFRTFLFTFTLGYMVVGSGHLNEVPVPVPEVESDTPIIIRLCPDEESGQGYQENGNLYFSKEKIMNCVISTDAS